MASGGPDLMEHEPGRLTPCTAMSKRSGQPCRNYPAPGATVCRLHGGAAAQVRAAAARREEQARAQRTAAQRLVQLGELPSADPLETLMALLAQSVATERALAAIVSEQDTIVVSTRQGPMPSVEVELWERWIDRAAKIAKSCLDAGIEARQIDALEAMTRTITTTFLAALADAEWGLAPEQQDVGRRVIARVCSGLSAGSPLLLATGS